MELFNIVAEFVFSTMKHAGGTERTSQPSQIMQLSSLICNKSGILKSVIIYIFYKGNHIDLSDMK